jgi:hypothetical protein
MNLPAKSHILCLSTKSSFLNSRKNRELLDRHAQAKAVVEVEQAKVPFQQAQHFLHELDRDSVIRPKIPKILIKT